MTKKRTGSEQTSCTVLIKMVGVPEMKNHESHIANKL